MDYPVTAYEQCMSEHRKKFPVCSHDSTIITNRVKKNGASNCIRQCLTCGAPVGQVMKTKVAIELCGGAEPVLFDVDKWSTYQNAKHASREHAYQYFCANRQDFFDLPQWHSLRYDAFKLHGRKCLCCGRTPPEVSLHVDHIKPRSLYPELSLDINNLQILCADCNYGKSNTDETDFRVVHA